LRIAIRLDRCGSSVVIQRKSGYGSSYFFSCSSIDSVSVSVEGRELIEVVESADGEYLALGGVVRVDLEDLLLSWGRGRGWIVSVIVVFV
jgi:hypothetical protein